MKNEKIQLSISLLVSNTIDTIKKCMDSLLPILNNIPSELIIVDTGGIDGSIKIAKEYTNIIVPFKWCNDFAKARNAGLEIARGEWFLFLDDDEWFENVDEIIEFFKSKEYLKFNCASYAIRNYKDKEGKTWSETRYTRMVKLEKNTKFISPIHEIIDPTFTPEKYFNTYVHHYGYVFENDEDRNAHAKRNIDILHEVIKKESNDHRLMVQLAQEYGCIKDYEKSMGISQKDFDSIKSQSLKMENDIIYAGWHMKNLLYTNIIIKNKEEAYNIGKKFIKIPWINVVTKNNITHALARLSYEFYKEEDCFKYLETYINTYDKIIKNENIRLRQTILDQTESYTKENYYLALLSGFKSAVRKNNEKRKRQYINHMSQTEFFLTTEDDFIEIINYLFYINDKQEKNILIGSFLKNEIFRSFLSSILQNDKIKILREDIINILSESADNYHELIPYKIIVLHRKNEQVKELLDKYFEKEKNVLFLNPEILDIFVDKIDICEYINKIPIEGWIENVDVFLKQAKLEVLEKIRRIFNKYKKYDGKISNLKIRSIENIFLTDTIEEKEFLYIDQLLKEYIDIVLNFNLSIFKEEVFMGEMEFYLPDNCRFCNKIQYIYTEDLDELSKAKIIREAVDLYPRLASFCNVYIKKMQEESQKVTDEFLQLAKIIKKSIRNYITIGQLENARITLNQLEQLIPNDPEIVELKMML